MQPPMQPPVKKKNNMPIILAIVAIVVVVVIVLAVVLMGAGGGTNNSTPTGTVQAAFDGVNRYDEDAILAVSMEKFESSTYYNTAKTTLDFALAAYDLVNVKVTVSNILVTSSALMSQNDKTSAEAQIANLPYYGVSETVTDYCMVSYTTSVSGWIYTGGTGEVLLFEVQGKWYLSEAYTILDWY